jgi:hypothetical protein
MITLKKHKIYPDLFNEEKSVTKRLSILLTPDYHKLTLNLLIEKAKEILSLEDTYISEKKKKEYLNNFDKQKSVLMFQKYIANIVFNGSNLSMKSL